MPFPLKDDRQPAAERASLAELASHIKLWGAELGFDQVGIADVDLGQAETRLLDWLAQGFHGEMDYMAAHGVRRARPGELIPGTVRVVSARMNYFPQDARDPDETLNTPEDAYVARYALAAIITRCCAAGCRN